MERAMGIPFVGAAGFSVVSALGAHREVVAFVPDEQNDEHGQNSDKEKSKYPRHGAPPLCRRNATIFDLFWKELNG